ncbi:MAG: hypothetical protein IKJ84_02670 [Oscillospiraceae bacterium]|nr:hypothetical protein [Oscillospiraceae bacterium]
MTATTVILVCIGVLALLVLICAVALWWNRSGENKAYDERQLVEQGRARAVADTVEMVYYFCLMVYLTYTEFGNIETLPVFELIFIGLLIQIMTYNIYCLMTHALLPFGQSPILTISSSVIMSLVQFGNYALDVQRGASGFEGLDMLHLVAGTAFAFYALIHLIALLRKERE